MTKSDWNFQMQGDDSAEVYLYEEIGEFWGKSAKDFATELDALGDIKNLSVRINSMGGSVFDGFSIHSLLKNHSAHVTINIDGIAASIASVIAMAGDEVKISENGFIMLHEPWTIMAGTAQDFRNEADVLDKLRDQSVKAYSVKTGLSEADILTMVDGVETWLNAEEATERGFADSVMEPNKAAALVVDRNLYPNAPEVLKHRAAKCKAIDKVKAERTARDTAVRLRILDIENASA